MGFFLQLRMLLWKNFLLRKQQKKRLIVELMWPLFLFLILMWVRTRGLRTNIHECHFTPKAMPSMGQFPFVQSFICTFNNTCHKTVKETEIDGSRFNSLTVLQFLSDIRAVFSSPRMTRNAQTMDSVTAGLQDLVSIIRNVTKRENQTGQGDISIRNLLNNSDSIERILEDRNIPLETSVLDTLLNSTINLNQITPEHVMLFTQNYSSVLCNEQLLNSFITTTNGVPVPTDQLCSLQSNEVEQLVSVVKKELGTSSTQLTDYVQRNASRSILWQDWSRFQSLSNQLVRNFNDFRTQSEMINGISVTGEEYRNLMNFLIEQNATQFEQSVIILNHFLCGNESENLVEQLLGTGGETNRFDSLSDQFKDTKLVQPTYVYDNTTTKQCNDIFEKLESNPATRLFWRMMKPFVRGKILYTPERTVTKRIMDQVNQVFYPVKLLHDLSYTLASTTLPFLREVLVNNTENLQILKEFYELPVGQEMLNNTVLRDLLGNNYDRDIEQARKDIEMFMDINNTEYRAETFQYLIDAQYNVSGILECFDWDKVQGYSTEEDAMKAGMKLVESNKLWALVVFEDLGNDTHFSPNITYKIRMNTERVDSTEQILDALWRPGARMRPAIDLKYITYGFAYLQDMLDHNIIREQSGRDNLPGILLQQFPYPCYISDEFVMAISRSFPLFMVLSWVYTCSMIVKSIVYEKEERLKETMRVMGLGNGIHWLGWFIDSLLPMLVTIFVLTIILVYGNVLQKADPTLVFCFLTVYGISTIAQAFLISVFFSRANISAASGGIIFFILYLPYPFMVRWMYHLSSWQKAIMSLSSNVAFGLGASYLSLYEEQGTGIGWRDIWQSPLVDDGFCLAYVLLMLILDALIYFILTWYIEAVFPGQYGIPKPWYFPFTRYYWFGTKKNKLRESTDHLIGSEHDNEDSFEKEPTRLTCGVSIQNLGMVYANGKMAVKGLNINFYEDQITSFLGHNGAGKTTTISILTGLFPPTFGTASIYGLDICSDMDIIRNSLGMCPQHNVLFHLLSVEEHLWFYARLRGQPEEKVKAELETMIQDLGLPHKRTTLAKDLSGGMQRKLSVAIAFIGASKTVILDEPTSGVDPYSRRSIWDLLIKYKKGRTVILTTHYMDEADFLGDRIAIIANGQLQCCGTSVFLKTQFGSGYYLTIEMDMLQDIGNHEQQDMMKHKLEALTICVNQAMPTAKFLEQIGGELIYVLPERDNLAAFTMLFNLLDANKEKLNIHSYGISDTSLEEIFLRVAERGEAVAAVTNAIEMTNGSFLRSLRKYLCPQDVKESANKPVMHANGVEPQIEKEIVVRRNGACVKYTTVAMQEDGEVPVTSSNKYWRQFMALHIKRFHHTRRNKKALFSELVIPALFVCLSLIVTSILPKLRERPPLVVSPWIYNPPRYMFFSNASTVDQSVSDYTQEIIGSNGLGTVCLYKDDGTRNEFCSVDDVIWPALSETNSSSFGPDCSCETGSQICPAGAGKPDPPSSMIISGDTMFNLTGKNISEWLLKTQKEFDRSRFGGYTFGVKSPVPNWNLTNLIVESFSQTNSSLPGFPFASFSNNTTSNNIKVWYNNKGWVSSVGYMNAINNVVLRASLPTNISGEYGITTINHPVNFTSKQLGVQLIELGGVSLLHSIAVIFALSFVPASFTLYLIEEKVTNSKHLQLISGVSRLIYWLQAYSWDIVCYIVSASLCVLIFLIFNEQSYVSPTNFPGLIVLLLFYGWSSIPLMYPASFIFKVPSSAFVGLACINMFIGIITTVSTFVLSVFDDEELRAVGNILQELFLIFPHYCLGSGLMKLASSHLAKASLATYGQQKSQQELSSWSNEDIEVDTDIFAWTFLGKNLLCMFFIGLLFFFITLLIEFRVFKRFSSSDTKSFKFMSPNQEDEDVWRERQRINEGNTQKDILIIKNLSKIYSNSQSVKPAVSQICVGVQKGECFGLLGLNGAGKTSTFEMLTGATDISSGDATIEGWSIKSDVEQVRSLIGYCPQFDALDALLTPREHLELYARLRNIPSNKMNQTIDASLIRLGLGHYSDRCAGTLSGGNKRKLSTAIALLGKPHLVFLDEPTSGMDPKARRFLWSCIQDIVREGCSVILTSHSMEECQALCTRLTIMVNGQFKCLGSSQHLKNRFGKGYSLVLRCKDESLQETVKIYVRREMPDAELVEAHYCQLHYQLAMKDMKLDTVFQCMERARQQSLLQDYSLSQTTLEDVFIRFASEQADMAKQKHSLKYYFRQVFVKKCTTCCSRDDDQTDEEVTV